MSVITVAQSCPTLCDPKDCGPPGFSVDGILQARILEWVAIPFSMGSSQPRDLLNPGLPHCRKILYHMNHQGPQVNIKLDSSVTLVTPTQ